MADTLGVTVLSPTGLSTHDGCHFGWKNGYKLFGEQVAATLLRDFYDGPSDGVAAPNPVSASFTSSKADRICVQLASKTDPLTVGKGSAADFRLRGSSAKVTDVRYLSRGKIELDLSAPALDTTSLAYVAHNGAGPMIRTSRGVGLLAFDALPVSTTPAPELFDTVIDALQTLDARAGALEDAGDLSTAQRDEIREALSSAQTAVEAAIPSDGGDVSAEPQKLIAALDTVRALHESLRTAELDAPVLRDLDTRLTRVEQLLSRAVSLSLGLRITIAPAPAPLLPGQDVEGTVRLANSGSEVLTGLSTKVAIDGWDVTTGSLPSDSLAAGQTIDVPFTTAVPRRHALGEVTATARVEFTSDMGTFEVDESKPWATVSSGVEVDVAAGDPVEHASLTAEVSNAGTSTVRGQLVVATPEGWASPVPSDEVSVEAGSSVQVEAPVVIPRDIVAGDAPVTVKFVREGSVLGERVAAIPVALPTPPTAEALDHVDFGDAASESEHVLQASAASGTSVEAGVTRRYANGTSPGSWFSAEVDVPAGEPFILRNVETFGATQSKKYRVYVDDRFVRTQVVAHHGSGAGTETYDLLVDDPEVLDNDGSVQIKYEFPADSNGFFDPSLADSWVLPVGGDEGWKAYSGPVSVSGDGKHELSYRAKDVAGNSTDEKKAQVWIDGTAPWTQLSVVLGSGVDNSDKATLKFTAQDVEWCRGDDVSGRWRRLEGSRR